MRRVLFTLAFVFVAASLAAPAHAQFARAGLEGTVSDPDGSPLPGVTVTVTNEATGQTRTAVTGVNGRYNFNGLVPATYTVDYALQGFNTTQRTGVQLLVGQTPTVDIVLALGGVEETITVTADSPMVETTSKEIGGNITSEDFVTLPTQGRSFVMFASLLPGIVPNESTESTASDALFINGQDDNNNSFNVDGANNDDDVIGARAGAQTRTAIEAIQEFQILTTQFDAEFGRTTGGVLNAVTKSGGNRLRGSAFYFRQDSDLNAKNFFTERNGGAQPDFTFSSIGATLGGPVIKDNLFFFGSYERISPDAGESRTYSSRPELSFTTVEDNLLRNLMGKLDWQAAEDHKIAARFLQEYSPQFNQVIGNVTLDGVREEDDTDTSFVGTIDSVVGANGFNNLRFSITRENVSFANPGYNNGGQNFAAQRALDVAESRPSFVDGANTVAQSRINHSVQFDDTYSLFLADTLGGDHNFRVGGHWSDRREDFFNSGTANGQFNFDTDAAWNRDDLSTYPLSFNLRINGETTAPIPHAKVFGAFIQDDFQPSENLTLNIGLRYDWESITDDNNNIAPRLGFAYDPSGSGKTVVRGGWGRFYERFQLGSFANFYLDALTDTGGFTTRYPLSGNNQGLFWDIVQTNGITSLNQLRDFIAAQLEGGTAGLNTGPTVDLAGRTQAYAETLSLGVEHELRNNLSVGADYIHTQNRNVVIFADLNDFSLSNGRPNISVYQGQRVSLGGIGAYTNGGKSNYNGFQFSLNRRMSDSPIGRLQGRVSYTYATQSGNVAPEAVYGGNRYQSYTETGWNFDSGTLIGQPVTLNLDLSSGMAASWHRDHNFVASWAWVVPGTSLGTTNEGLIISGVFRWMTGGRYTPQLFARLDNNNRQVAPAGTYSAGSSSDIALQDLVFDGKENGARNPDFQRLDLSFRYRVPVKQFNFTVMADFFNITNRVNFIGTGTSFVESSAFLIPTSANQPREFQFGIRADF